MSRLRLRGTHERTTRVDSRNVARGIGRGGGVPGGRRSRRSSRTSVVGGRLATVARSGTGCGRPVGPVELAGGADERLERGRRARLRHTVTGGKSRVSVFAPG